MSALDDAWQAALAAEERAAFGYSLLGPRLSGEQQQLAVGCSDAHETLRDATRDSLVRAGHTPVAAAADYPGLYPVGDAGAARALAVRIEDDCAAAWRFLYAQAAASDGTQARSIRTSAQAGLTASAVRATRWRAIVSPTRATTAFPGID